MTLENVTNAVFEKFAVAWVSEHLLARKWFRWMPSHWIIISHGKWFSADNIVTLFLLAWCYCCFFQQEVFLMCKKSLRTATECRKTFSFKKTQGTEVWLLLPGACKLTYWCLFITLHSAKLCFCTDHARQHQSTSTTKRF